jgi:hypothetical protein
MKFSKASWSLLLLLGAGLPHLGCFSMVARHPADVGLPFEALPPSVGQTSCSVFFSNQGSFGRLYDMNRYVEQYSFVDESMAERRANFLGRLQRETETLRPGEQTIGITYRENSSIDSLGEMTELATWQSFVLYASCLTQEGAFECNPVPVEVGLRSSIVCAFSPFFWHEVEPMVDAPEAIEVEYASIRCSKEHGVHRESCRGGWFIKLHRIRLATE